MTEARLPKVIDRIEACDVYGQLDDQCLRILHQLKPGDIFTTRAVTRSHFWVKQVRHPVEKVPIVCCYEMSGPLHKLQSERYRVLSIREVDMIVGYMEPLPVWGHGLSRPLGARVMPETP